VSGLKNKQPELCNLCNASYLDRSALSGSGTSLLLFAEIEFLLVSLQLKSKKAERIIDITVLIIEGRLA